MSAPLTSRVFVDTGSSARALNIMLYAESAVSPPSGLPYTIGTMPGMMLQVISEIFFFFFFSSAG